MVARPTTKRKTAWKYAQPPATDLSLERALHAVSQPGRVEGRGRVRSAVRPYGRAISAGRALPQRQSFRRRAARDRVRIGGIFAGGRA